MLSSRSTSRFTLGEQLGVFVIVEASCISMTAVSLILCLAVYRRLRRAMTAWRRPRMRTPDASDSSLFLNLMVADLIQATGNLPSIKWMLNAHITEDALCTAQAVVKQIGIVGVSMTSLAIAVHTFAVLVLLWKPPRYTSRLMIAGVWTFAALVIGIPNAVFRNEKYYGASGYWCWIRDIAGSKNVYLTEEIVTEYLWVWIAALLLTLLYTVMFAVLRGWLVFDNGFHWHKNYISPTRGISVDIETEDDKNTKAVANLMLFYPAVYIFCILPNTIARWIALTGSKPPYQFTLFGNTIFALSGAFNATVFFITRPDIVVGTNATPEDTHEVRHEIDVSNKSTHKFGHLPDRDFGDVLVNDIWRDQEEFDPNKMTHERGTSPIRVNTGGSLPRSPLAIIDENYTQSPQQDLELNEFIRDRELPPTPR